MAALLAMTMPVGAEAGVSTSATAAAEQTSEGGYTALQPGRLLDTRTGNGVGTRTPVGPRGKIDLQVTGRRGVPAGGVSAVVLNLTSTQGTRNSFFTAWPAGKPRPATSSLNFVAGETRANLVTVPVGTNGRVSLFNWTGSAHMIADVVGFYRTAGAASGFGSAYPEVPFRLFDSRDHPNGLTHPGGWWTLGLEMAPGIDPSSITALAINITAINPSRNGYLKAWSGAGTEPNASSLNYTKGTVTPNMAIVKTRACASCFHTPMPVFEIANYGGSVHFAVDVVAVYDDTSLEASYPSARYRPLSNPVRIVDTRSGLGTATLGGGQTRTVATPGTVAGIDTWALSANLTAVRPSKTTYVTSWPFGFSRPVVSNLNAQSGDVVANMAMLGVGEGNRFNLFNFAGRTDVLVDVSGTFELYGTGSSTSPRAVPSGPADGGLLVSGQSFAQRGR